MKNKYTENSAIESLSKKNDVQLSLNKEIHVLNGKSKKKQFKPQYDLGNGSWGKIDFLVNYCGYRQRFVAEFL